MCRQLYALLGYPVKHSVSPQMQEAGFRAIGLDAVYELIEVMPEHLEAKVAELKASGCRGWNVTIPHKAAIIEMLDAVELPARIAGSVNTVVNASDGRLLGYSTDGYGLERSIREAFGLELAGGHFLFWGAGGAARATSVYFAVQGARAITLVNRTVSRAEALAATIRQAAPNCETRVLAPAAHAEIKAVMAAVDVLIQATSVGLHAGDPSAVPAELLLPGLRLVDMIYHRKTPLLQLAAERGCRAVDGTDMLLYQGVKSFQLWTGAAPRPRLVGAMRRALTAALV